MGVGGWVCPPHSLPYTLTTTRRANKLILKSRIGALPPCAGTLFLGFLAGRVRRLEGALEEPQAVGSGPRDTASTVEYLARGRNATSETTGSPCAHGEPPPA